MCWGARSSAISPWGYSRERPKEGGQGNWVGRAAPHSDARVLASEIFEMPVLVEERNVMAYAPRIPVAAAYAAAVGQAVYNFAYLEWAVIWSIEKLRHGELASSRTKTAGQIAQRLGSGRRGKVEAHATRSRSSNKGSPRL